MLKGQKKSKQEFVDPISFVYNLLDEEQHISIKILKLFQQMNILRP